MSWLAQPSTGGLVPPLHAVFQTRGPCNHGATLQVETKTRHEIEEKKKQLRQVVGNSYRWAAAAAPGGPGCIAPHT